MAKWLPRNIFYSQLGESETKCIWLCGVQTYWLLNLSIHRIFLQTFSLNGQVISEEKFKVYVSRKPHDAIGYGRRDVQ